jgi:hypothetical protein
MYLKINSLLLTLIFSACAASAQTVAPSAATGTVVTPATVKMGQPEIPRNIAEAAEQGRAELLASKKPPAPAPAAKVAPMGAMAPAQQLQPGFLPIKPPVQVNPSQEMKLVSVIAVDNRRTAGISIMGSTFQLAPGASIGNGWVVESIAPRSVVVRNTIEPESTPVIVSGRGKYKNEPVEPKPPRIRTLFLDAGARQPVAQQQAQLSAAPIPMPMSVGNPYPR